MRTDTREQAERLDKRQPVMRRKGTAPSLTVVIGAPPSGPPGDLGRRRDERMEDGTPSMQAVMTAIEALSKRLAALEARTDDRSDEDDDPLAEM